MNRGTARTAGAGSGFSRAGVSFPHGALVAKEIKLLLPAYLAALLLTVAPMWIMPANYFRDLVPLCAVLFLLGELVLAVTSFGREFSLGTFATLLALPVNRGRLWWTKVIVLATALGTMFCVWEYSCQLREVFAAPTPEFGDAGATWFWLQGFEAWSLVLVFAGALWTTLLLRQIAAAAWVTLLLPFAVAMALDFVEGTRVALGVYAVAGFLLAWRLFFRAQEVGWTGGTVALPEWPSAGRAEAVKRTRRPWGALLRKEVELHKVSLAGIGVLLVLHVSALVAHRFGMEHSFGSTTLSVLSFGWVVWAVAPMIIGGASVAEERRLGTSGPNLCLPMSARIQYGSKLVLALLLGGLLTTLLGVGAEKFGALIGARADGGFGSIFWISLLEATAITLVFFYASTMAGNLIQALVVAVVAAVAIGAVLLVVETSSSYLGMGDGWLFLVIFWPSLAVAAFCMGLRNFRAVEGWGMWAQNAGVFLGVLAASAMVSTFTYNRAWELVMPGEPAHGPARLTGSLPLEVKGNPSDFIGGALRLPDGRMWNGEFAARHVLRNEFLPATNWVDAARSFRDIVAIRADGTLWHETEGRWPGKSSRALEQCGQETNWVSVVNFAGVPGQPFVLLRRDGTLWTWGDFATPGNPVAWPDLDASQPERLGTDSDWARMMPTGWKIYAWKKDGTAWLIFASGLRRMNEMAQPIGPHAAMIALPTFDNLEFRSLVEAYLDTGLLGVKTDGSLWSWPLRVLGGMPVRPIGEGRREAGEWKMVTSNNGLMAGIKADGTLWKWGMNLDRRLFPPSGSLAPTLMDSHHDWVAVGGTAGGFLSVGADGSVWLWETGPDRPNATVWTRPTRLPKELGNILEAAK